MWPWSEYMIYEIPAVFRMEHRFKNGTPTIGMFDFQLWQGYFYKKKNGVETETTPSNREDIGTLINLFPFWFSVYRVWSNMCCYIPVTHIMPIIIIRPLTKIFYTLSQRYMPRKGMGNYNNTWTIILLILLKYMNDVFTNTNSYFIHFSINYCNS